LEIEIVPATLDHARAIRLRPGDAREIAAMGLTPIAAFEQSMSRSLWAQAHVIDGEVAALVGLAIDSILGGVGAPWLLTGRPVDRHRKLFLQETRRGVARMRAEFSRLANHVHAEYGEAIRWLRWLGFGIGPAEPKGPHAAPFRRFSIGDLRVTPCRVVDLEAAPDFAALADEYADESLIDGMPPPKAYWSRYRMLEDAGLLSVFAAKEGDALLGFISVLTATVPRYAQPIATTESFFVARAYRRTGSGLRLLRAAERRALEIGAAGLLVSAPTGGRLADVLPRAGYRETNRVFFRSLRGG
jgi:GNAT superfamily N-acetyltransferase